MRHDLSGAQPPAVLALPFGVIETALPACLVAASCLPNTRPARRRRTRRRAVPMPPITGSAQQEFPRATRAPPHPQPLHAAAVAAAVDFAGRPCEARSTGGSTLLRSAHFGSPGPATPRCFLSAGAAAVVSTTTRHPSAKPTRLYRTEGDTPSGSPEDNPFNKTPRTNPALPRARRDRSPAFLDDRFQLGHHSIQLTGDIYAHLAPGANRAAADRLDALAPAIAPRPSATPAQPNLPGYLSRVENSPDFLAKTEEGGLEPPTP